MIPDSLRQRVAKAVRPRATYQDEVLNQGLRQSLSDLVDRLAVAAGRTERKGRAIQFEYHDYKIPIDLAELTGGGAGSWDEIAQSHLRQYEQWAPIEADHRVLEVGCGIGRDAMHLADLLSPDGSYVGIDISEPSIRWCRRHLTKRYPNFRFVLLDVSSAMYNPEGSAPAADFTLPVASNRFDRIVLHSVFTHMFFDDVAHYLREFRRVLAPGGVVLASFFIVDDDVLAAAARHGGLTFAHQWDERTRLEYQDHPEGAVAYTRAALDELVDQSGLELRDLHPGFWNGMNVGVVNGQDVAILIESVDPGLSGPSTVRPPGR